MHIHTRLFLWLGPRERVIDSMIMYAYVPWSSFVPCCLPPASPFRMGPPRSVRSLASFLSPDRTAGRVVYLCHSSTQIRLSYLFSPVAFLAMPFQGCNATAAPLGSQGRATCMDWENSPSNFEVETKENARLTPSDVCICAPESFLPNSFLSPVLLSSLCLLDFLLLPSLTTHALRLRPPPATAPDSQQNPQETYEGFVSAVRQSMSI